ncbi:MAG TPA: VOC family protein, partial [Roseiflexaceae bacterium]|nr:VOC family protein [Roseiflexaceae bacterium]
MRIIGTHHIALRTPNFEQMRAFYSDVLGMAYLGGFAGKNIIFLDAGTTTVELIEWEGTPEQPSQGWHHLALEVEDTDAAYAELVAQGVPFAREYGGQLSNRSFGGAQVSRTFYARGQTGQQLLLGAYASL